MVKICPLLSGVTSGSSLQQIECLRENCRLWNADVNECSIKHIDIVIRHLDKKHFDRAKDAVPKAAILVQEYQGNQEIDRNGLIYGRDFKINESDPQIPKLLSSLQAQPDFPEIPTSMTWQEYLDSLPEDPDLP